MSTILEKIKSLKLCLMAHPDNEENSEFADRISDLEDIEKELLIKRYEVDFNGNLLAGIEVSNSSIKIYGAINGYGNAIDLNDIKIKEVII